MRWTVAVLAVCIAGCLPRQTGESSHDRLWQSAREVLAERFRIVHADRFSGVVEADSLISADLYGKYRTRVVAKIIPSRWGRYEVEVRASREYEYSEPSGVSGKQPGYRWVTVGFDHELEVELLNKIYESARTGRVVSVEGSRTRGSALSKECTHLSLVEAGKEPGRRLTELILLGDIAMSRGEFREAVAKYRAGTALEPHRPLPRFALVNGLVASGQFEEASKELKKCLEDARKLKLLDLRKLYRERFGEIKSRLVDWFSEGGRGEPGLLLLGYFYIASGAKDMAREILKGLPASSTARLQEALKE